MSRGKLITALNTAGKLGFAQDVWAPTAGVLLTQVRHGMGGVPEYWGKPSPYSGGTDFLGTPKDHLELVKKRPLSPDVFEVDGKSVHYKFQSNAISSITNRATGVALSFGFAGLSAAALAGDATTTIELIRSTPLLLYPAKAGISFAVLYHFFGGLRHFAWDYGKIGNQSDTKDLLQLDRVKQSSTLLFVLATAGAAVATVYSY